MPTTWKIAVLGLTHDHVWEHVEALAGRDDVVLCAADPNAPLLERARGEFAVEHVDTDAAVLLERQRPDAVLVFTDNAGAAPLVELAASHGLPVMVEKPMADTLANAERMRVAVNAAGVPLMVNWPTNWNPAVRHALDLAAGGAVGEVFRFSFRGGHGGPKEYGCTPLFYEWLYDRRRNGAGAYIDYCGYGASMARLLLGMPARAQASIGRLQKDYVDIDDNAILLLRYHRSMAVIEATWTAAGPVPDGGPTIWGSSGTLVVRRSGAKGYVQHITAASPDGTTLEPPPLLDGEHNATSYFLSRLASGQPFEGLASMDIGRDTQEILEAGLLAARGGGEVSLPLDLHV